MKKQFVFIHISHLKDDVRIISVSSSLTNAMQRAKKFMKRHKIDDDYKFHARTVGQARRIKRAKFWV